MATIPVTSSWSNGETPTASKLNAQLKSNWAFYSNVPRVKVYRNAGQTMNSTNGDVLLHWTNEIYDTDSMWSIGADAQLYARTAGCYQVDLHINWNPIFDTNPGNRFATIILNSVTAETDFSSVVVGSDNAVMADSNSTLPNTTHISTQIYMNVNDYLCASVYNSLLTTSVSTAVPGAESRTFFGMRWISYQ